MMFLNIYFALFVFKSCFVSIFYAINCIVCESSVKAG